MSTSKIQIIICCTDMDITASLIFVETVSRNRKATYSVEQFLVTQNRETWQHHITTNSPHVHMTAYNFVHTYTYVMLSVLVCPIIKCIIHNLLSIEPTMTVGQL